MIGKGQLYLLMVTGFCWLSIPATGQPIPSPEEKIPYLVTFGGQANAAWGDDDHCQILFFVIPTDHVKPVYIRIFDPDTGGELDEQKGSFNTTVKFSVYGGDGIYSEIDEENKDPVGQYRSGLLLAETTFGNADPYDNNWYTFGPFNPAEAAYMPELGGNILKVIAQGIKGDDGNLYRYFLSSRPDINKPIEGGNAFTYEYCFRLDSIPQSTVHIYPFVDDQVLKVKIYNFDLDNDGLIRLVSRAKRGLILPSSGDDQWLEADHIITTPEKNASMDLQLISHGRKANNNVVIYVTNQYGDFLPFYSTPIGGVPKYNYKLKVE